MRWESGITICGVRPVAIFKRYEWYSGRRKGVHGERFDVRVQVFVIECATECEEDLNAVDPTHKRS